MRFNELQVRWVQVDAKSVTLSELLQGCLLLSGLPSALCWVLLSLCSDPGPLHQLWF